MSSIRSGWTLSRLVGGGLVATGLVVNQWLLMALFPPGDGQLAPESRALIWLFQLLCLGLGLLVLRCSGSPEQRRKLRLWLLTVVLVVVAVELGLQGIFAVVSLGRDEVGDGDSRYLLPAFHGKPWAKELFAEFHQATRDNVQYEQFIGWDRGEFHGRYINVDAGGIRRSWNPADHGDQKPLLIFVFGGSTLWGHVHRDGFTIPSLLSKRLAAAGIAAHVVNYGEICYSSNQELVHLAMLLRDGQRPDLVIFYDGFNDVYCAYQNGLGGATYDLLTIRARLQRRTGLGQVKAAVSASFDLLKQHLMLYRAFRGLLGSLSPPVFPEVASTFAEKQLAQLADEIVAEHAKSMMLLDHLAQAYGFRYHCFWQPTIYLEHSLVAGEQVERRYDQPALFTLSAMANKRLNQQPRPRLSNIAGCLAGRTEPYYFDCCHINEEGNDVVAAAMLEVLGKDLGELRAAAP